jgi:hypothetical protein
LCSEITYVTLDLKAVKPKLELSQRVLQFGDCPVNEHVEIVLAVKNGSMEMPLTFSINKYTLSNASDVSYLTQSHSMYALADLPTSARDP